MQALSAIHRVMSSARGIRALYFGTTAALLFSCLISITRLEYGDAGSAFDGAKYTVLVEKIKRLNDYVNTTAPSFAKHTRRSRTGHRLPSHSYISSKSTHLDLSPYSSVIDVDRKKLTVLVESGCHIEALIDATLKHGLIPKVLPEFRDITVGGAIVGTALEASSYKWGQFNDICREIHVLCGDGSIRRCSKHHNEDLWHALPGSYGTLGTVLCAEIECMKAEDWVLVSIRSYDKPSDALSAIDESSRDSSLEFLEGLQFPPGPSSAKKKDRFYNHLDLGNTAVITGKLVDVTRLKKLQNENENETPIEMFHASSPSEEFYYEKIQREANRLLLSAQQQQEEQQQQVGCVVGSSSGPSLKLKQLLMPLKDFLFRYDRGAFWMARPTTHNLLAVLRTPLVLPAILMSNNNPVSRLLFRWLFTTNRLYSLLHKAHPHVVRSRMVVMDVYSPLDKAESFIELVRKNMTGFSTPLWLCPVKRPNRRKQPFSPHGVTDGLIIDFGVYGRIDYDQGAAYTRKLDVWTLLQGARKMLYSQHTYSKDEFWYDGTAAVDKKISSNVPRVPSEIATETSSDINDINSSSTVSGSYSYAAYAHTNSRLDRSHYISLRKKYGAEGVFPDLYDKVCGGHRGGGGGDEVVAGFSNKRVALDKVLAVLAVVLNPFRLAGLILHIISDRLRYLLTWLVM